ncbi:MAG: uracil-DNA glycosylase [Gemmatimonadaceae bacterium]|nr:uracil-DNA glycosylase [Gemmatimonadaceae bacterium]
MSDARERLRQYLEQRREMGEREFVLDSLSVEEALKVLTTGAAPPPFPERKSPAPEAGRGPGAGPGSVPEPPRSLRTEGVTEDWRSIVGAPDPKIQRSRPGAPPPVARTGATPAPGAPSTEDADAAATAPPAPAPRAVGANPSHVPIEMPAILAKAKTLDDVAKAIAACKACSLSGTAINHVPGEGDPNAKFVVVGEAPGATEDELGRPFVGKSGELLTKILEAIDFRREQVFICNVIKHRPPMNRNPSPDEVAACAPFLLRQLELLKPKVILALGNFAAQTLLETDLGVTKLRATEHSYRGIPLVVTFHPAALLRNPNYKRPAWEDVQLARRIFDRA